MSDLIAAQQQALEAWAEEAISAGWLHSEAKQKLHTAVTGAPAELFNITQRPLVVGFFGGTGVGKSTLLNRFAGDTVASASALRPTSQHVTLYAHQDVSVENLPTGFLFDRMNTAEHTSEVFRHVLFVDMPDFDSVETNHREQVNQWLPHLDIVLYVVSPERYRDDQGWRLLLKHATQHAWLFVMNQWDRGDPAQIDDFIQQIKSTGIAQPLVYKTDCVGKTPDDDFQSLQDTVLASADQVVIAALDELGVVARLKALKASTDSWLTPLRTTENIDSVIEQWPIYWQKQLPQLHQVQQTASFNTAQSIVEEPQTWLRFIGKKPRIKQPVAYGDIIDESLKKRFDSALSKLHEYTCGI